MGMRASRVKSMILAAFLLLLVSPAPGEVKVKIRDIAFIDGLKENQVFGYGLVVGLQGTGDTKSVLTQSSLKNLLKNIGFQEDDKTASKNIAAVLLTAKLPAFVRVGDRVDVTVSSIGDAKSLEGGILVQSPLKGADDRIYLVVQGNLSFPDVPKGGKSIRTVARVIGGGIVEREIEPDMVVENSISLVLKNWDFTVADQIVKAVADKYPDSKPALGKGGKIRLFLPANAEVAEFVSNIEKIEVTPSSQPRVVINERDGTIVMGGEVKISEVVVSKEGITIKVDRGSDKGKDGREGKVALLKEASSVKDLVESLNYIGASTRDIISILKALKDAGALHAELIIR